MKQPCFFGRGLADAQSAIFQITTYFFVLMLQLMDKVN